MELVLLLTSKPHRRCTWWAGQDSNLRRPFGRQIYSLLRLTTPPPTQNLYHILESDQVILCINTAICVSSPLNDRIPTIKAHYIGPSSVWCSVCSNRSIWRRFPRVSNQQGNPNWFYVFDQLSWTPGGFEPHPSRCQRDVLPGYTTRPIIRQNLARCHQRKLPIRTVPVHLSRDACAYNTDDNSVFVPSGESNQTHI